MRFLAVLTILIMTSCNSDLSTAADKQACRDIASAGETQTYEKCVKRASDAAARDYIRSSGTDMSP